MRASGKNAEEEVTWQRFPPPPGNFLGNKRLFLLLAGEAAVNPEGE